MSFGDLKLRILVISEFHFRRYNGFVIITLSAVIETESLRKAN